MYLAVSARLVVLLLVGALVQPAASLASPGGADPLGEGGPVTLTGGAAPNPVKRKTTKPKPKPKPRPPPKPKPKPKPPPRPKPKPPSAGPVFPLAGAPYGFGGPGSRFGAGRPGHIHQGQDIPAPLGTPVLAPRGGSIIWFAEQPGGAGIYLVLHGSDGRDYVFMHLQRGSVLVVRGSRVRAGQTIAQVGLTGATTGPHLHFEIWVGGWQSSGGHPIDPLPELLRWRHL